ncbi:uncharacterized protein LOC134829122 [Culicoides brevitarsis]|uniref:uncharacterized protein LOC134829122 n=1 Tax=Culicoides brevitarsis TaxID=469753 RepID=UPI00307BAD4C
MLIKHSKNHHNQTMAQFDIFSIMKLKCWIICVLLLVGLPFAMNSSGDEIRDSGGSKSHNNNNNRLRRDTHLLHPPGYSQLFSVSAGSRYIVMPQIDSPPLSNAHETNVLQTASMMTTLAPKSLPQIQTRTTQATKYSDIHNSNLIYENTKNSVDSANSKLSNNKDRKNDDKSESSSKSSNVLSISESVDESLLDLYNTPMYFGTENSTVVMVQAGAVAHLPCTIHHIGEGVVSWLRRKDETYHLLTVALTTYSSDERFTTIHLSHSEDWTLQIKFVQVRDSGVYECQVSTHPPSSIFIHLNVVEARAEIVGTTVRYLTPGSTLKLICRVLQSTEKTAYIFWYHNNRMINYDVDRGINVSTEADFHYSELTIQHANKEHSGNYTCVPQNSQPASTIVHIFKGDHPAAMYHEHRSSAGKSQVNFLLLLSILIIFCTKFTEKVFSFISKNVQNSSQSKFLSTSHKININTDFPHIFQDMDMTSDYQYKLR